MEDVPKNEVTAGAGKLHSSDPVDLTVAVYPLDDAGTRYAGRIVDKTAGVERYHVV